ncbi:hypothetical protein VNI00_010307 [Paramarasmius palmivorus]|uniref:F-box domain-containing protein n=1 Tax=Paramarasmius palmivorus TaxID=297713 RepID=A0AAW0CIW6_9AGAR
MESILDDLDREDILTTTLISRSWVIPSRARLFTTFRVPYTLTRLKELQTLLISPHCTFYLVKVRQIEILGGCPAVARFIELCGSEEKISSSLTAEYWSSRIIRHLKHIKPRSRSSIRKVAKWSDIFLENIEKLSIHTLQFPRHTKTCRCCSLTKRTYNTLITQFHLHSVQELNLRAVKFSLPDQLAELLVDSLPSLATLTCEEVRLTSKRANESADPEVKSCSATLHALVYLKLDVSSLVAMREAQLLFPKLRQLVFYDDNRYLMKHEHVIGYLSELLHIAIGSHVEEFDFTLEWKGSTLDTLCLQFDLPATLPSLKILSLSVRPTVLPSLLTFKNPHCTLRYVTLSSFSLHELGRCTEIDNLLRKNVPRLAKLEFIAVVYLREQKMLYTWPPEGPLNFDTICRRIKEGGSIWEMVIERRTQLEQVFPWCTERGVLAPLFHLQGCGDRTPPERGFGYL